MRQGHTVTRRVFLDEASLRLTKPGLAAFMARPDLSSLIRYVGGTGGVPVMSIQSILANQGVGADDPQCAIHSDTFHSTSKAWFFLHDVGPDDGPFFYVPGSHTLTPQRLAWERAQSIAASRHDMRDHAEGSFPDFRETISQALGLPQPQPVVVKANTLVVADTFGFHGRTPSSRATQRVELYSTLRRNPFLPWTGSRSSGFAGGEAADGFVPDHAGSYRHRADAMETGRPSAPRRAAANLARASFIRGVARRYLPAD